MIDVVMAVGVSLAGFVGGVAVGVGIRLAELQFSNGVERL